MTNRRLISGAEAEAGRTEMSTPKKLNPYYGVLQSGLRDFVLLNGVLFQFSTHIEQRAKDIEAWLGRKDLPAPFAASALIIADLTATESGGFPLTFPVGAHLRKGHRYLTGLHEISARESAWTVAQGYEAFELFVKRLSSLFLHRNAKQLDEPPWKARRRKAGACGPVTKRLGDVSAFVDAAYGGANDLLKRLSASLPNLSEATRNNKLGLDLPNWIGAVSAVRHATIHNRAVVSSTQMQRCGLEQAAILKRYFPGRAMLNGHRLMLDPQRAEDCLERFAEYAFLIYKMTSLHEGLDYTVFRQDRIST